MEVTTVEARPLSKEEYEQWVATSAAQEAEIKAGLKEIRGGLWRAAKALYYFNEGAGWSALGYEGLGEWLADPDVTMTRATYYRMVSAWQEFFVIRHVDESKLKTLDLTKAAIALPALKRGEATVEDVMADVESLGARDIRLKYTEIKEVDEDRVLAHNADGVPTEVPADDLVRESYGVEMVPRAVAETLVAVLEAILSELGSPERKAMSKRLREQVSYALDLAHEEGVGV